MEQTEGSRGFDFVLKELLRLHKDSSLSKGSHHRPLDRVLIELMAEKENSAVERAVAAEQRKQQSELMAEREKAATERLQQQEEMVRRLQMQQEEFQVKLEKRDERMECERREHKHMQDQLLARQDELLARQDHERRVMLEQLERQQIFYREVVQQLQDRVKVFRHDESDHLISGTQGGVETPGKRGTTASSSPYSMTPLSLMMETPNKPFDDSIGGGEVVENFAAGESGSVDETNNYVENDAVEEEEPTSVMEGDQGSVFSDEIQRAKGLISFEESFLLNKSGQVGNKVENEKGKKLPLQKITTSKSRTRKESKEKMKMIGGKQKLILMLHLRGDGQH